MQTIWSRIVQSRISCHCPSCTSTGLSGVARQTTSTAGRRPMRPIVSSTFVYSTIFAAAATTDAGYKQKRRDQWDRAIADIRHDLDTPRPHPQPQSQPEQHKIIGQDTSTEHIRTGQVPEEEMIKYVPITEQPLEALLDHERSSDDDMPVWPINTGVPLERPFVAPNSIYAPEWKRREALRSRWTPKKLRVTEFTVDKLILQMLIHLDKRGLRSDVHDIVPESCLSFFAAPVDHLKTLLVYTDETHLDAARAKTFADFNELYPQHEHGVSYREQDTGDHHHVANELNAALELLFKHRQDGRIGHAELITKICYNLYISDAPPSLGTWNTLMTGLLKNDEEVPLLPFVRVALRNAGVRMNEITLQTVLKSYIIAEDAGGFSYFIDKMRGLRDGLALTRPMQHIGEKARSRLVRDEKTDKIIQLPYPTPGVFEVLIEGVLRFVGFDAALRVCKDMGTQGWGLSTRGLTMLLDDRALHGDWESGLQVWDLIKELQQESRRIGRPERLLPQTYTAMMRLCSATNRDSLFTQTLQEALSARYTSSSLLKLFKAEMSSREPRTVKVTKHTEESWQREYQWFALEKTGQVVTKKYRPASTPEELKKAREIKEERERMEMTEKRKRAEMMEILGHGPVGLQPDNEWEEWEEDEEDGDNRWQDAPMGI